MTAREETLCCYMINAKVDVFCVDKKPDTSDFENDEIQATIFPIINSIMSEDPETQEDIKQDYVKLSEQETTYDHIHYLFFK